MDDRWSLRPDGRSDKTIVQILSLQSKLTDEISRVRNRCRSVTFLAQEHKRNGGGPLPELTSANPGPLLGRLTKRDPRVFRGACRALPVEDSVSAALGLGPAPQAALPRAGRQCRCASRTNSQEDIPGMEFEATDVQEQEERIGRRRQERRVVSLPCRVRSGTDPWRALRVLDLSQRGFRLCWIPSCSVGSRIWIRIGELEPLAATVRWKSNEGIGCEFIRPLGQAVLDHLSAAAPPSAGTDLP